MKKIDILHKINQINDVQVHKLTTDTGFTNSITSGDFNSFTKTGWFYLVNASNSPETGASWYLEVSAISDNQVYQRAIKSVDGNDELIEYERTKFNGNWTNWRNKTGGSSGGGTGGSANDVQFDNSGTNIQATTVQGAITEINQALTTVDTLAKSNKTEIDDLKQQVELNKTNISDIQNQLGQSITLMKADVDEIRGVL